MKKKLILMQLKKVKIAEKVAELKKSPSASKKTVYVLRNGTRLSEDDYEPRLHARLLKETVQEDRTDEELRTKALREAPKTLVDRSGNYQRKLLLILKNMRHRAFSQQLHLTEHQKKQQQVGFFVVPWLRSMLLLV